MAGLGIQLCRYLKPLGTKSQQVVCPSLRLPALWLFFFYQQSDLSLSKELSILVNVFLIRKAVNLADGLWYQHSFMSLASEVNV